MALFQTLLLILKDLLALFLVFRFVEKPTLLVCDFALSDGLEKSQLIRSAPHRRPLTSRPLTPDFSKENGFVPDTFVDSTRPIGFVPRFSIVA
jgi:hypothetical protein